jgi:hypothetical protein
MADARVSPTVPRSLARHPRRVVRGRNAGGELASEELRTKHEEARGDVGAFGSNAWAHAHARAAHAHTRTSTMRGHAHGRYLDAKDPKNSDEQEVDEDDVDTFGQRHKDKMDHVAEPRHLPNRLGCRCSPSA